MRVDIRIPQQGNTIDVVYLNKWLKSAGDTVKKGEPLLETESDKAVLEVESPADGILAGILVENGNEATVLATVGWIEA